MTKKDLFRVILKLAGLYFIFTVLFNTFPNLIMFINFGDKTILLNILLTIGTVAFFVLLFSFLVFKPDLVINILKLDKNFDDDYIIIKRPSLLNILQVGIIILGLSVIVKQLPMFITKLFFLFKAFVVDPGTSINSKMNIDILTDYVSWTTNIISLTICFLMVTNSKAISNYILTRNTSNKIDKHNE